MSELQNKVKRPPEDPRSTVELFAEALTAENEAVYWSCVHALRRRGGREVYELSASLALSPDSRERELGIRTLAHIELPENVSKDAVEVVLLEVLALESDPKVLVRLAGALDSAGGEKSIPHLIALSRHSDPKVRIEAVCALMSQEETQPVMTRLIELTQDPEGDVRNWATFALAKSDVDTPELRQILLYRTRDENTDARGEAMCGLAYRGDARVVEPLLLSLAGEPGYLSLMAARMIGDPRLYPALQRLRARGTYDAEDLAAALAACRPRKDSI